MKLLKFHYFRKEVREAILINRKKLERLQRKEKRKKRGKT
jgi:rRNA processing protein Gar1